jgi:hypothetical protein
VKTAFGEFTFGDATFGGAAFGEFTFGDATFGGTVFGDFTFGDATFGDATVVIPPGYLTCRLYFIIVRKKLSWLKFRIYNGIGSGRKTWVIQSSMILWLI